MSKSWSAQIDAEFEREVEAERQLLRDHARVEELKARARETLRDVSPYGPRSKHSWVLDSASTADNAIAQPAVRDRLQRFRAASEREQRASTSATFGGLIPATIPPYVAEAVAYGVRSTAPLATALLRLDLPPVGMSVAWAKTTGAATVTNQTAENAALTASTDLAVSSTTDALGTIAAFADFSVQSQELSGGWFDRIAGEELGRAYGARLESQCWIGTGANQQLKGFTQMTGNSSSTVSGQTLALTVNKIADQFQQIAANLGQTPDLLALAPRRYAILEAATGALGLEASGLLPAGMSLVISPAAPVNLGAGTNEDWPVLIRRDAVPLVAADQPSLEFHRQGPSAGSSLTFRWLIYGYAALGVSRRPEGVGTVRGLTSPVFT